MIREMQPHHHDGSWHVYKIAGLLKLQHSSNAQSMCRKFKTLSQMLMHTVHLETGNLLGCFEVLVHDHTSSKVHAVVGNGLLHFLIAIGVITKPLNLHKLHYDVIVTMNHSGGDVRVFIVEDKLKCGVVKHGE